MSEKPSSVSIFIDLDGVLADFDAHARAGDKYDGNGRMKWDALDEAWWATIPAFAGAKAFYDAACALGTVKFLTAPVMSEACFSGKARWVQDFVPERGKFILQDLIICPSGDKEYLAAAGRILVDDREQNVKAWERAGGIGIRHTGDFAATLQKLKAAVAQNDMRVTPQAKPPRKNGTPPAL